MEERKWEKERECYSLKDLGELVVAVKNAVAQGPQGVKGDTGADGAIGRTGEVGAKGDAGTIGPAGAKGDVGDTGSKGEIGMTGSQGDPGLPGQNGIDGRNGADGMAGRDGKDADVAVTDTLSSDLSALAARVKALENPSPAPLTFKR